MRKFRKSLDNGTSNGGGGGDHPAADLDPPSSSAVNSPRAPRKSKGPSMPDGLNEDQGSVQQSRLSSHIWGRSVH